MACTSITIDVTTRQIREGLQKAADTGRDTAPLMEAIGQAMVTSTQARFEAEAGPGGAPWSKLAASTVKRMSKRRQLARILRDTSRLYSSLTFEAASGEVTVGTNVIYGAIHQFGGEIQMPERQGSAFFRIANEGAATARDGRRVGSRLRFAKANSRAKSKHQKEFAVPAHSVRIPARPYLGIDQADEQEILATTGDFLKQAVPDIEGAP